MKFTKRKSRSLLTAQPEVSLTPLIDTALTLLIIFMVTTPMIHNSLKIDLPHGQVQEAGATIDEEFVIAIDPQETIYCNNKKVTLADLEMEIKTMKNNFIAQGKDKKKVWVKVARQKSCSAEIFLLVLDTIKKIGGLDIAIPTERTKATA